MITYYVRHASSEEDLSACLDLRAETAQWLADQGIDQWEVFETGRRVLAKAYADGTLYVIEDECDDPKVVYGRREIVGCLRLDGPDQDFWDPWECAQPALYLYKFMITNGHRGSGLGDAVLDWASHRARECGAKWLRMDCRKDNTALQRYYLDRGFRNVGLRAHPGRDSGWLGERDVHVRTGRDDIRIVDETQVHVPGQRVFLPGEANRYDSQGKARVWVRAEHAVLDLKTDGQPAAWNDALEQAARVLDRHASEEKQADGMYHRPLLGQPSRTGAAVPAMTEAEETNL